MITTSCSGTSSSSTFNSRFENKCLSCDQSFIEIDGDSYCIPVAYVECGHILCDKCAQATLLIPTPFCYCCGKTVSNFKTCEHEKDFYQKLIDEKSNTVLSDVISSEVIPKPIMYNDVERCIKDAQKKIVNLKKHYDYVENTTIKFINEALFFKEAFEAKFVSQINKRTNLASNFIFKFKNIISDKSDNILNNLYMYIDDLNDMIKKYVADYNKLKKKIKFGSLNQIKKHVINNDNEKFNKIMSQYEKIDTFCSFFDFNFNYMLSDVLDLTDGYGLVANKIILAVFGLSGDKKRDDYCANYFEKDKKLIFQIGLECVYRWFTNKYIYDDKLYYINNFISKLRIDIMLPTGELFQGTIIDDGNFNSSALYYKKTIIVESIVQKYIKHVEVKIYYNNMLFKKHLLNVHLGYSPDIKKLSKDLQSLFGMSYDDDSYYDDSYDDDSKTKKNTYMSFCNKILNVDNDDDHHRDEIYEDISLVDYSSENDNMTNKSYSKKTICYNNNNTSRQHLQKKSSLKHYKKMTIINATKKYMLNITKKIAALCEQKKRVYYNIHNIKNYVSAYTDKHISVVNNALQSHISFITNYKKEIYEKVNKHIDQIIKSIECYKNTLDVTINNLMAKIIELEKKTKFFSENEINIYVKDVDNCNADVLIEEFENIDVVIIFNKKQNFVIKDESESTYGDTRKVITEEQILNLKRNAIDSILMTRENLNFDCGHIYYSKHFKKIYFTINSSTIINKYRGSPLFLTTFSFELLRVIVIDNDDNEITCHLKYDKSYKNGTFNGYYSEVFYAVCDLTEYCKEITIKIYYGSTLIIDEDIEVKLEPESKPIEISSNAKLKPSLDID